LVTPRARCHKADIRESTLDRWRLRLVGRRLLGMAAVAT
jgi:hypothetical protein